MKPNRRVAPIKTERRASHRIKCEASSKFKNLDAESGANFCETFISDISETGIRFRASEFIPIHNRLSFQIDVPKRPSVELIAKPVWIKEIPTLGQYDIGATFITLTEEDRSAVQSFCRQKQLLV